MSAQAGLSTRARARGIWRRPTATTGTAPAQLHPPPSLSSDLIEHREGDRRFLIGSLLCLWAAGASVLLAAVVALPPPASRRWLLLALGAAGYAGLGLTALARHRLPSWAPEVCAYLCHVMVGTVVWAYGERSAPFALFYLWFGVHAFYFLPWRRAVWQLPFVGVTYAVALSLDGAGPAQAMEWVLTMATLGTVSSLVAVLRVRFDALVERLAETAATDPLTGLGNRATFDTLLEREFERARRANRPLSLVLGDLDGFKAVNDRFGHRAGDDVLRRVAVVLRETCRAGEPPLRLGGDEFGFVLVDTDTPDAAHFAERVRAAVEAEFAADALPVAISLGIACYPADSPGLADLFRTADDAVYAAKPVGRRRGASAPAAVTAAPRPPLVDAGAPRPA